MEKFITRNSHRIVTVITIILVLVFSWQVMSYLIGQRKKPEQRPRPEVVRHVTTELVSYESVTTSVIGRGRLVSKQAVVISSEVRGKILEGAIPFKIGQTFKKNAVLINIYNKDASLDLKAKKSSFLQALAQILPDMKVDYKDSYSTWMDFFASIDLDRGLPELPATQSNQEKIFLASKKIISDYYSIKSDEVTLSKYTIRAPFDGTFINVNTQVGSIANPGAVLANIIRTDRLELEVKTEAPNAKWISIGDKAAVFTENGTDEWEGKVVRKANFIDPGTQSITVFVELRQSKDNPLYEGQYLRALFNNKKLENVMEVSRKAVFNNNDVYIVEDGLLKKSQVDIHKVNETTVIFSGLEENTALVVEPLVNAMENMKVETSR